MKGDTMKTIMKVIVRIIQIAAFATLGYFCAKGTEAYAATEPSSELIEALIKVESNGKSLAIGDNGKAKGCLQLWESYINDVNRIAGTSYRHNDAFNYIKAREITKTYLTHYGKRYKKLTGKEPTDEVFARIHNGGPNGYNKTATVKYWNKVKKQLAK